MKSLNNYGPRIKALQQQCAIKLCSVTLAYGYNNGRPAQRYLNDQGQVRYRPWRGPTGGPWIKGRSPSAPSSPLEK